MNRSEQETREVRELWAFRWPDGSISGVLYSDDGSDYAEQTIRRMAPSETEVIHRTRVITTSTTPWVVAPRLRDAKEQA